MILTHYTIKCQNNIIDIINELKKIDNGYEVLYVNSAYVTKDNKIILEIDEKQAQEIIDLTSAR